MISKKYFTDLKTAQALMTNGKVYEALAILRDINHDDPLVCFTKATCFDDLKLYDEAITEYTKVIERYSYVKDTLLTSLRRLAVIYHNEKKDLSAAEMIYRKNVAFGFFDGPFELAWMRLADSKNKVEALEMAKEGLIRLEKSFGGLFLERSKNITREEYNYIDYGLAVAASAMVWNDIYDIPSELDKVFLLNREVRILAPGVFDAYLMLLFAKNQKNTLHRLFALKENQENHWDYYYAYCFEFTDKDLNEKEEAVAINILAQIPAKREMYH